ncbi:hypothetical protein TNCV_4467351 [Trichonephila clavipes]|nr:hypothetical protein TNCV_4467351 [Trichonephila clavipes]
MPSEERGLCNKKVRWKLSDKPIKMHLYPEKLGFKAFTYLMISTKMKSPDYDYLVYMLNLSPLPSTPVASPSHEPSQDGISLPPMEQSMCVWFPSLPWNIHL